jgi:hypothetical protein
MLGRLDPLVDRRRTEATRRESLYLGRERSDMDLVAAREDLVSDRLRQRLLEA